MLKLLVTTCENSLHAREANNDNARAMKSWLDVYRKPETMWPA
jgi:hypothetical protein